MSEEPCAVNSLCKQSWTHPLTSKKKKKKKKKQKNNQSGVGTASISSAASSRSGASSQEVSASTPHVFPALVHRAGGRHECNPSESSLA